MRCIEIWITREDGKVCEDKLQHEMYWNQTDWSKRNRVYRINYNMRCIEIPTSLSFKSQSCQDKLQHEMYWNRIIKRGEKQCQTDKLQHEMYWNEFLTDDFAQASKINYNMRCIEISFIVFIFKIYDDKLQHEMYWNSTNYLFSFCSCADKLQHEMYWNVDRTEWREFLS